MAQEGTSPVPSQDDSHPSNLSSSTTSKTPRTLSFINNVQTAVAQIENKLATTPSASPPPPNRNEIPVTPPGPDHPVIDRVQFLESSLAISPSKRTKMSSLAESVFGGTINPDSSLASAGVFVSTTPRTNINATVTNSSARSNQSNHESQTGAPVMDDPTANDTDATPSIAPIVEQFETPITPVFSKENDSEIVGAPIAPIVEQFEGPIPVTDSINQQDLVEFASGTVAPMVDQFEDSKMPEPEAHILEQTETSESKRTVTDSQHFKPEELFQERADTVGADPTDIHNEVEKVAKGGADGRHDGSSVVQNLPAVPAVERQDSPLDESLECGGPSNDEVIQIDTDKPSAELLTIASPEPDGISIGEASLAESHSLHEDTGAASASSESQHTVITSNNNETGEKHEQDESALCPDTELLSSLKGSPLLSVAKKEDTSIMTTVTTVLPTEMCAEATNANSSSDVFSDDDCKTDERATAAKLTESPALSGDDIRPVDDRNAEDLETETVETLTVIGKDDNTGLEACLLNETTEADRDETVESTHGTSTASDMKASANETTTSIVSPVYQSSDAEIATGDAISNRSSSDETTKTSAYETENSAEAVDSSAVDENTSTAELTTSAKDIVDSTCGISKSDNESPIARTADNRGTEILDPTGEVRRSSEMKSMDPTVNVVLPVTKTVPRNRSSNAREILTPVGGLVEKEDILNSTIETRSTDAAALATKVGTPDIQFDNSMNITIVVQTTSTPVSTGVTVSTDDSAGAGKQPTPKSAYNTSGDAHAEVEDVVAPTMKGPASYEESEAATKQLQKNELVSAGTSTISSAENEDADDVKEKERTLSNTNERSSATTHGEQPATPEQEPHDTRKKRAIVAREKLSNSRPERAVKSPSARSPITGTLPQAEKLKPNEMPDTSCDSTNIVSTQSATWNKSPRSKSSSHLVLRSPTASSKRAGNRTESQAHRQPLTRSAITPSPGTKKGLSTTGSLQREVNPPQSEPSSPLRLSKSSSQSLPRLPRVAGLSNTRNNSSIRFRSSLNAGTSERIPRPSSRLSSPLLPTRKSGLSSSPVTPKSASKPSRTPRLPLRRTLSFTNSRMFDSPSLTTSHARYSLSQKVEEMKRASGNRASPSNLSGSGSKPPLGRRPRVTVPEPFALFGPELHEMSEKQMDDARRKQDEEAARPRVFKPRPLPNFLKTDASQIVRKDEPKN